MPVDGKDFRIGGLMGSGVELGSRAERNLNSARDIERRLNNSAGSGEKTAQTGTAGAGGAVDPQRAEAEKAATDFEALLLHQMFQAMWTTVPSNGVLTGSNEEGLYRDMLNEALSKQIAESQSIGIKEVVLRDLKTTEKK